MYLSLYAGRPHCFHKVNIWHSSFLSFPHAAPAWRWSILDKDVPCSYITINHICSCVPSCLFINIIYCHIKCLRSITEYASSVYIRISTFPAGRLLRPSISNKIASTVSLKPIIIHSGSSLNIVLPFPLSHPILMGNNHIVLYFITLLLIVQKPHYILLAFLQHPPHIIDQFFSKAIASFSILLLL